MDRVAAVGGPDSGKTSLSRRLASAPQAEHVELDEAGWQPEWVPRPTTESHRALREQLAHRCAYRYATSRLARPGVPICAGDVDQTGAVRPSAEDIRKHLLAMGAAVRAAVFDAGRRAGFDPTAMVADAVDDTIFAIDEVADRAVQDYLARRWPSSVPVRLVMEGHLTRVTPDAVGTLIVDPVDGTRGLMHDKRSAWFLAAFAPVVAGASLTDISVAAMTELTPSKQSSADEWSAVRGAGPAGVVGARIDRRSGDRMPLAARPSDALSVAQQWASVAMFLPTGIEVIARFSASLFRRLGDPQVFHDQYLSSGGQLHELLTGRDVLVVDPRPLVGVGTPSPHPYDLATALVASEAGCVIVDLDGAPLNAPLDTTSSVGWIGVANAGLAEHVLPAVTAARAEVFG